MPINRPPQEDSPTKEKCPPVEENPHEVKEECTQKEEQSPKEEGSPRDDLPPPEKYALKGEGPVKEGNPEEEEEEEEEEGLSSTEESPPTEGSLQTEVSPPTKESQPIEENPAVKECTHKILHLKKYQRKEDFSAKEEPVPKEELSLKEKSPPVEKCPVIEEGTAKEQCPQKEKLPAEEESLPREELPAKEGSPLVEEGTQECRVEERTQPKEEKCPVIEDGTAIKQCPQKDKLPAEGKNLPKEELPAKEESPLVEEGTQECRPEEKTLPKEELPPKEDNKTKKKRRSKKKRQPQEDDGLPTEDCPPQFGPEPYREPRSTSQLEPGRAPGTFKITEQLLVDDATKNVMCNRCLKFQPLVSKCKKCKRKVYYHCCGTMCYRKKQPRSTCYLCLPTVNLPYPEIQDGTPPETQTKCTKCQVLQPIVKKCIKCNTEMQLVCTPDRCLHKRMFMPGRKPDLWFYCDTCKGNFPYGCNNMSLENLCYDCNTFLPSNMVRTGPGRQTRPLTLTDEYLCRTQFPDVQNEIFTTQAR